MIKISHDNPRGQAVRPRKGGLVIQQPETHTVIVEIATMQRKRMHRQPHMSAPFGQHSSYIQNDRRVLKKYIHCGT
jgi:hypothetical protein